MNSMTGFGRAEGTLGTYLYSIEIKSVNHRYLDARFRLPPSLAAFEIPLNEHLRSKCERGSFEIYVKQRLTAQGGVLPGTTRLLVDELAAKTFVEACAALHQKYQTAKTPSLEAMVLTNRIFLSQEDTAENSQTLEPLKALFDKAVQDLLKMRGAEGLKLREILTQGLRGLETLADKIAALAPTQPVKIKEKLTARLQQMQMSNIDAQRLEWEVALYADRAEISEEIDRLRAHTKEFATLLRQDKPVGRKLDFMTQELHREINTMGAKAASIEITKLTVEAKTAIEKLREQVQNVE